MISLEASVLVVEDSDEDFDTVVEALANTSLRNSVQRASSGDQCLELLRGGAGSSAVRPAFVLLDLNTPGMDGRDALVEIRADAATWQLPVVVLSTSANPRDVAQCYERGANAYHVKPTHYDDHLRLVQSVLSYWLVHVLLPDTTGDLR